MTVYRWWLCALLSTMCLGHDGPLFPNFYDEPIYVDDVTKMNEVNFRVLTATAYRAYGSTRMWCGGSRHLSDDTERTEGRPYLFKDYIGLLINMVDMFLLLQFTDSKQCEDKLYDFRNYLVYDIKDKGYTIPGNDPKGWYSDVLYTKSIDAFSCGFDAEYELNEINEIKSRNPAFDLPYDIRENYEKDEILQKSWRLLKDYLTSTQKQHERAMRREDYDVSLYFPFLGDRVDEQYGSYMDDAEMRAGFPSYIGNTLWFLFHSTAQRIADIENVYNVEQQYVDELLDRFKNFFSFFVTFHPCPVCREHFITSVSKNDVYWRRVERLHDEEKMNKVENGKLTDEELIETIDELLDEEKIEAYRYPLEWLFIKGEDYNKNINSLPEKMAVIESGNDLVLFLWKLHNAVSSAVGNREECKMEEGYDDIIFRCNKTAIPRIGRQYPFAKRFEFELWDGIQDWNALRDNVQIKSAIQRLYELDREHRELRNYWRDIYNENGEKVKDIDPWVLGEVLAEIKKMDDGMIADGILKRQYTLQDISDRFDVSKLREYSDMLKDTRNYASDTSVDEPFPDGCFEEEDIETTKSVDGGKKTYGDDKNKYDNNKGKNTYQDGSSSYNDGRVGGDIDKYGCRASAGYTWCAAKSKCLRLFEEDCDSSSGKTWSNDNKYNDNNYKKTDNKYQNDNNYKKVDNKYNNNNGYKNNYGSSNSGYKSTNNYGSSKGYSSGNNNNYGSTQKYGGSSYGNGPSYAWNNNKGKMDNYNSNNNKYGGSKSGSYLNKGKKSGSYKSGSYYDGSKGYQTGYNSNYNDGSKGYQTGYDNNNNNNNNGYKNNYGDSSYGPSKGYETGYN